METIVRLSMLELSRILCINQGLILLSHDFRVGTRHSGVKCRLMLPGSQSVLRTLSDCSMLLMGPKFKENDCRLEHLLAHSGVRIAGNDFDIQLALQGIMPSLGMNSLLKTGKTLPTSSFFQALAINNINEQT